MSCRWKCKDELYAQRYSLRRIERADYATIIQLATARSVICVPICATTIQERLSLPTSIMLTLTKNKLEEAALQAFTKSELSILSLAVQRVLSLSIQILTPSPKVLILLSTSTLKLRTPFIIWRIKERIIASPI